MGFWTAVVVIVGIIAVTEMIKSRHRAKHGITMDWLGSEVPPEKAPHLAAANAELLKEVEHLRERIAVLERIVTDDAGARSLAHEIETLRDKD